MTHRPTRRAALTALAATALAAAVPVPARAAPARSVSAPDIDGVAGVPLRLALPAPGGPHPVGTTSVHLVDPTRNPDRWAPSPRPREVNVRLWYPAAAVAGHPRAPWMTDAECAHLEAAYLGVPAGRLAWPLAHARQDAPADRTRRHPVVLNSHGSGGDRSFNTTLAEHLASHGYVVAAVDHTFDAGESEFPGHRLEVRNKSAVQAMTDAEIVAYRAADVRLLLDGLGGIAAGRNPDADHHPLPEGLGDALDLATVGMFGHSMGGATTVQAMADDPRLHAGAVLDGPVFGVAATAEQARPLLLMASAWDNPARDRMWDTLWPHLTGWRHQLTLAASGHLSYTDLQLLIPQGQSVIPWSADQLTHFLGTGDPARAVAAQRAYLTAFFDLHLRHRPTRLFDAPRPRYPEIRIDR